MNVTLSDSAISDLKGIGEYYIEEDVSDVGQRFIATILARIETLTDHPDIGRIVPEFNAEHIRELIHPPFRIVYLRDIDSIHIIRIWRSERLLVLPEN